MFRSFSLIPLLLIFLSTSLFSIPLDSTLSISNYLVQVKTGNSGYKSAVLAGKGSMDMKSAAKLLFSPYAFLDAFSAQDKSPSFNIPAEGTKRFNDQYKFGLAQQTPLGQQYEVYFQGDRFEVEGAMLPVPEFYQHALSFQISQDLFRNFFGQEVRAQYEKVKSESLAGSFQASYAAKMILVQAETIYWTLSLARDMVRFRNDTLDRSKELYAWVAARVERKLADKSDLMQAKSDVQYRTMELAESEETVRSLSRSFNLLRGAESDLVDEALNLPLQKDLVSDMTGLIPQNDLLRSKGHQFDSDRHDAAVQKNATLPKLQAYFSGSLNGLNAEQEKSITQSTKTSNLTWAVGVSLNIPIDIVSSHKTRVGLKTLEESYQKRIEQERVNNKSEFEELQKSIQERVERLKLVKAMEATQREKADYEYIRLRKGSTVTAQVLRFEQDYAQSRLARAALEMELLGLLARLKTYDRTEGSK